jgi:hypothetical protein
VLGHRHAIHPGQSLVDPEETQVGAEHGEADRGLGEESLQRGQRIPHPLHGGGLRRDGQHTRTAPRIRDRTVPHLHVDEGPVAMPDRQPCDDRSPRPHRQAQTVGQLQVLLGHENASGILAHNLLWRVTEQVLRGERPLHQAPIGIDHPERERDQVLEHPRLSHRGREPVWRFADRIVRSCTAVTRAGHEGTSLTPPLTTGVSRTA